MQTKSISYFHRSCLNWISKRRTAKTMTANRVLEDKESRQKSLVLSESLNSCSTSTQKLSIDDFSFIREGTQGCRVATHRHNIIKTDLKLSSHISLGDVISAPKKVSTNSRSRCQSGILNLQTLMLC